jgi:hypothetical protein
MVADGFTALTGGEFDNQTMSEGSIEVGLENFANLPAGTTVVLGLVAWTGSSTATAAIAPGSTAHLGVLAFPQYIVNSSLIILG